MPSPAPIRIRIIYRDEALIVVDKPAGLLVIPSPKGEKKTLTSLLNQQLREETDSARSGQNDGIPAGGVAAQAHPGHRIDRDTSGIIVYAIGKSMQQKIMDLFAKREVHKSYIALVNGVPGKKEGSLNQPIEGQSALTKYRVLAEAAGFSVVEAIPVTGRTNQIRIHFSRIGHPLLGDDKFGVRKNFAVPFKRTALHAYKIEFRHPVKDEPLHFAAPLPADMSAVLVSTGLADELKSAGVQMS